MLLAAHMLSQQSIHSWAAVYSAQELSCRNLCLMSALMPMTLVCEGQGP